MSLTESVVVDGKAGKETGREPLLVLLVEPCFSLLSEDSLEGECFSFFSLDFSGALISVLPLSLALAAINIKVLSITKCYIHTIYKSLNINIQQPLKHNQLLNVLL